MNWEATGAIGEIIGAVAVVFSLIYLATQIRISNRASRQAAEQNLLDNQRTWLGRIGENDSLSTIWLKGSRDDPTLTEVEWVRYGTLCNEITLNWERCYLLAKDGDVSSSIVERDQRLRENIIGSLGYRKWFAARKTTLTEEFAELLESELIVAGPYSVPYANSDPRERET